MEKYMTITDALKGFDFAPWGGIEGFLEASKAGTTGTNTGLKRYVPDLAHGVDMTATAISGLPFEIVDKGGNVLDTSEDWQNKAGGMANPQRLLYLLASSLCGGSAYIIPQRTPRLVFDLQYVAPHTITPYIDYKGLQWFDRATDKGKTDRLYPNGILYFWLPDSDVELGPAENHPLGNAALDAQLIWNMKNTMKTYGERGFVPITLLGAKGMVGEAERKKAEGFFDRLLKGGFNVLAKIVNSETLTLIRVGAGMDELKQSYIEIKREAKEGIADSFGIPTALFMSDNAFASEFDALRKQWYTASRFVGIYQTIEETLSDQLLKQYDKRFRFNLQALEIFQEDESNRASSLGSFVSAVSTNPEVARLGMEILGYDLSKAQIAALDKIIAEKEANKEEMQESLQPDDKKPEAEEPETDEPELEEEADETPAKSLTADEIKDLALWYDKALAWHRKGKGQAVDWENKHLPEDIAAPIRLKLAAAQDEADIMRAFELGTTQTPAPVYRSEMVVLDAQAEAIKELALTIEKAIDATKGD